MARYELFLRSPALLYITVAVAVLTMMGLLMRHDFRGVMAFCLIGIVAYHFTSNMSIVLGACVIGLMLVHYCGGLRGSREGFDVKDAIESASKSTNKSKDDDKKEEDEKHNIEGDKEDKSKDPKPASPAHKKEGLHGDVAPAPATEEEEEEHGTTPNLDHAATLRAAYDSASDILGPDGVKAMHADSKKLEQSQSNIVSNLQTIKPMLDQVERLVEGLASLRG